MHGTNTTGYFAIAVIFALAGVGTLGIQKSPELEQKIEPTSKVERRVNLEEDRERRPVWIAPTPKYPESALAQPVAPIERPGASRPLLYQPHISFRPEPVPQIMVEEPRSRWRRGREPVADAITEEARLEMGQSGRRKNWR